MRHAAFVFDAYGTLFDVHAAVRRHAGEIGRKDSGFRNCGVRNSSNIRGFSHSWVSIRISGR